MNRNETAALLAYAAKLDPRGAPQNEAEAAERLDQWHDLLSDVPPRTITGWDAASIVRQHIATSPYPILPADISRRWHAASRRAVDRDTERSAPPVDPDDELAYRRALRGRRGAVAAGEQPPAAVRALTAGIGRQIPAQMTDEQRATIAAAIPGYRVAALAYPELAEDCPHCRRPAGKPCRSSRGRDLRDGTHSSRRDAYTARTARTATA